MPAQTRTFRNPLGFSIIPVTLLITVSYIAIFAALLYVHHVVPPAPQEASPVEGINITEAWSDLQELTNGYHPYNSHRNDHVHDWLLLRIDEILSRNGIRYQNRFSPVSDKLSESQSPSPVVVINDLVSNATYSAASSISVYFEGTNIIVYVPGSEDDRFPGLTREYDDSVHVQKREKRGVLVNAHYDSVSTGFGATDDGVGVVTILQLISYFTAQGQQPRRGLVALLNNGEEDYLNGARAFAQHPISSFPDTFLNLEGAGAGGRATLFRSTDAQVTRPYGKSPHPFGNVLSADAFKRGVIGSQTDYVIFNEAMGMRGLDVAFMEPRASYHTREDSTEYTDRDSLWHMLSAALETTRGLTSDTSTNYKSDQGSDGVWFDVFGIAFGLTSQNVMFAISVSLLVLGPVILFGITLALVKLDKWYLFARKTESDPLDAHTPDDRMVITLGGWRGVFRYPIAFVLATACSFLLALLLFKVNPYIFYSSQYSVWTLILSTWLVIIWIILRGADFFRASALQRAHSLGWIYALSWVALAVGTSAQHTMQIAGTFMLTLLNACSFAALFISYLEMFALPKKTQFALKMSYTNDLNFAAEAPRRPTSSQEDFRPGSSNTRLADEDDEPTETSSLLSRNTRRHSRRQQTEPQNRPKVPYGDEQLWSADIPSWTWVFQFLCLGPVVAIFFGQVGLLFTSATHQTSADGSPVLPVFMAIAVLSCILLLPISPFVHRFHYTVPAFLFLLCIGTLVYNLVAFPFSTQSRLDVRFSQEIDLESGMNTVNLTGVQGYTQKIVASLPSTQVHHVKCLPINRSAWRGLETCQWQGIEPNVGPARNVSNLHPEVVSPPPGNYASWLNLKTKRLNTSHNEAVFTLSGRNTRACKLQFSSPISNYTVQGASAQDPRFNKIPEGGVRELRLWSREWERSWTVHVTWDSPVKSHRADNDQVISRREAVRQELEGKAICLWNDDNRIGAIPALDEVKRYMPAWAIVRKNGDGLLEGSKAFKI